MIHRQPKIHGLKPIWTVLLVLFVLVLAALVLASRPAYVSGSPKTLSTYKGGIGLPSVDQIMAAAAEKGLEAAAVAGKPQGGRASASKTKSHWSLHKSWEGLNEDPKSLAEYEQARDKGVQDWPMLYRLLIAKQDATATLWGRIVADQHGALRIQNLEARKGSQGPFEKPALYHFHLYPKGDTKLVPSAYELYTAVVRTVTGETAGHLIVGDEGILQYGATPRLIAAIAQASNLALKLLTTMFDMLAALTGRRNWISPWTVQEISALLARFGCAHKHVHRTGPTPARQEGLVTDVGLLGGLLTRIEELEKAPSEGR